jgi:hypothetical protein
MGYEIEHWMADYMAKYRVAIDPETREVINPVCVASGLRMVKVGGMWDCAPCRVRRDEWPRCVRCRLRKDPHDLTEGGRCRSGCPREASRRML